MRVPADAGPSAATIAALIQAGSGHVDGQLYGAANESTGTVSLLTRGAGSSGDPAASLAEAERLERDREGPDGTIAKLAQAGSGHFEPTAQQFVDSPNRLAMRGNGPAADRSASGMSSSGN